LLAADERKSCFGIAQCNVEKSNKNNGNKGEGKSKMTLNGSVECNSLRCTVRRRLHVDEKKNNGLYDTSTYLLQTWTIPILFHLLFVDLDGHICFGSWILFFFPSFCE